MICFRKLLKNQGQMMISTYGFETFWSLDPCRDYCLSDEKITAKSVGANCVRPKHEEICPIMRATAVRPYDYGVQKQKMSQFCVGANVISPEMSRSGIHCSGSDFLAKAHTDTIKPLTDRKKRSGGTNTRKAEARASAFLLFG